MLAILAAGATHGVFQVLETNLLAPFIHLFGTSARLRASKAQTEGFLQVYSTAEQAKAKPQQTLAEKYSVGTAFHRPDWYSYHI